ncbi:MAG: sialate O-acetylesterase, partial [Muribaculaceae bacterium]|nr:sialate O-acetylesterase [Muribaculaceae bacterium]
MKIAKLSTLLLILSIAFSARAEALRVACVGNSVTYGYGLANRETDSYPAQLQRMLGDGYVVENFGHSGATLLTKGHRPYVQQPEFREALDANADIVVIHLGLNDTDPRNWPNYRDEFMADYRALIDSFRTRNPAARVMICRMTPITHRHPRFRSSTRDWFIQIQDAIECVAEANGVELIDLHTPLFCRPDLFPDAVHPNVDGAAIIASTVSKAITGNYGGLQLDPVYTSSMVLQCDKPVAVHGHDDAGSPVTLIYKDQIHSTRTGRDGRWSLTLSPMEACRQGADLTVMSPDSIIRLSDVVVGDVWICSGQSNMAFTVDMSEPTEVKSHVGYVKAGPDIRLYNMSQRYDTPNDRWDSAVIERVTHLDFFEPSCWAVADSASIAKFSAVGFSFGRNLADSLGVPIGLVCNAVGGTPIESWIDRRTLQLELPEILSDFANNDMIHSWVRQRAMTNCAGLSPDTYRHPYQPAYMYESAVCPIEGFPAKGIIWYQGESNAHNSELYARLLPMLVKSLRKGFGEDLAFYCVQLPSLNRPSWPTFRDTQRRVVSDIPESHLVVIHDLGDSVNVHPRRKMEVGRRLALAALHGSCGRDIEYSGPVPLKAVASQDGSVKLSFSHAVGLHTFDGSPVRTFEMADRDCLFYPAVADVAGDGTIILRSEQVSDPCYV